MPAIKRLIAVAILVAITMLLLTLSRGTYAHGEIGSNFVHSCVTVTVVTPPVCQRDY